MSIADTPAPPYYVVIFSAITAEDQAGYAETAAKLIELARRQPGFLGVEQCCEGGFEMTLSYWVSEQAIRDWKSQSDHALAQQLGRQRWYERYRIRVARVERDYGWER